jgi:hypothetical protein
VKILSYEICIDQIVLYLIAKIKLFT